MKCFWFILSILFIPFQQGCKADGHLTLLDAENNILPVIIVPTKLNQIEEACLPILINAIEQTTAKKIIVQSEQLLTSTNNKQPQIYFGSTKAFTEIKHPSILNDGFHIYQKANALYIAPQNSKYQGLWTAVNYFIEHYLDGLSADEGKILFSKKQKIIVPLNLQISEAPAFEFRQAYFPASTNSSIYQNLHGLHHFQDFFGCWGHNLGKLLIKHNSKPIEPECFALINGKRNENQFCFGGEQLYQRIVFALETELKETSSQKIWTIAPNDNAIICECNNCAHYKQLAEKASPIVCELIHRLALKFPNQIFSTLAYATTLTPPSNIKLPKNTMIMLSSIDAPKGIGIEQSDNIRLLKEWQKVCPNIYIWDYPIQYTNYFDVFPNMKSLQADMQYFKKMNVKGIFSHGSEENYSLFCEWKCYAISKLLWNPNQNLDLIRPQFFKQFYGEAGLKIEQFYRQCESNLENRKAKLDIYGNVEMAHKAYLNYNQLQDILVFLRLENTKETSTSSRIYYNVHKLSTCLELLSLQYNRWKGIHENGYAKPTSKTSWTIKPELINLVTKLQKATKDDEIEYMNENKDLVQDYLLNCANFFKNTNTTNLIWKKPIKFNTSFDDSYPANGAYTLNDGLNGTTDYSFNWLLFNGQNMDITLDYSDLTNLKKISLQFLHDPRHYIFNPTSIQLFAGNSSESLKLIETITPKPIQSKVAQINSYNFKTTSALIQAKVIRILATNLNELPQWQFHPTKKPSIACDEINIQ